MIQFNELRITKDGKYLIIDASVRSQSYFKDVYIESVSIDTQDTYKNSGPSESPVYYKNFGKETVTDPVTAWGNRYVGSMIDGNLPEKAPGSTLSPLSIYIHNMYANINGEYYRGDLIWDSNGYKWADVVNIGGEVGNPDTITYLVKDEFLPHLKKVSPTIVEYEKHIRLELSIGDIPVSLSDNMFFVYIKAIGVPTADTPCGMDNILTLGVTANLYPLYQQAFGYIKELSNTCITPKNFINFILQYKAFQLAIKTGHYTEAIKYWKRFFMGIKDSVITLNCGCHGQGT